MEMYVTLSREKKSDISHGTTWSRPANKHNGMAMLDKYRPPTFNCLQCCVDKSLFLSDRQSLHAAVCPTGLNMSYLHENVHIVKLFKCQSDKQE